MPQEYIISDERLQQSQQMCIRDRVRRLRENEKLDELRAIELLFYAQLKNQDVARLSGMDEKQIGLMKFRALDQIRNHVAANLSPAQQELLWQISWSDSEAGDSILTRAWEQLRPTCPKRSTLGRMLLGTLEPAWRDYAEFHVNKIGCRFCLANLDDLKRESTSAPIQMRERIFESTVGFLKQIT